MKKLLTEDIKKATKLLEKLNFIPTKKNKSTLFFPISYKKLVEDDGFSLEKKNESKGSSIYSTPGLLVDTEINVKEKLETVVRLGYAQIEYSPTIDIEIFAELTNSKLSKKDIEYLKDFECYLVKDDYILLSLE